MHPEIGLSQRYTDSLNDLDNSDQQRCNDALKFFREDPQHPSLRYGRVKGAKSKRLYKIRAADDIRIILAKEGNIHVFLLAGPRQDIYKRVERARFVIDQVAKTLRLVEPRLKGEKTPEQTTVSHRYSLVTQERGVVDHWADPELLEAGFDEAEIKTIRTLSQHEEILDLFDQGWDEETLDLIFDLVESTPEEWRAQDLFGSQGEIRLRKAFENFGSLHGISRLLSAEEIEKIASQPIEDWMIFLHPAQREATTRQYDGPARIKGSAGTGKTVVGLHWAAERARRAKEEGTELPILFTTFVKTLPPVFKSLYSRMPGSLSGAVEFVNVDKLAFDICRASSFDPRVNLNAVREASTEAFGKVVTAGTPLHRDGTSREYLETEVTKVIKGRGIKTVDEYLKISRTGRGTRFDESRRHQAWAYMEAWDDEKRQRKTSDFADNMVEAVEIAQNQTEPSYRSAVIDEAQDLTLMGLQLVRALVNAPHEKDRPDGLLIVGDGAQRIYPGAFTLRQAGVEVRGRTTILHRNYRNTAQILGAAAAVAGQSAVVDMEEENYQRGDEISKAAREGLLPLLVGCGTDAGEIQFIVDQIKRTIDSGLAELGDIGIFVHAKRSAKSIARQLNEQEIQAINLETYDGVTTPEVKVGTYARAKGLEFKVVFLPRVNKGKVPRPQGSRQADDEYQDQRDLEITEFFVAMTRARDQLIISYAEEPAEVLMGTLDAFEVLDAGDFLSP